jgi:hypothetical protein
MKTSHYYTSFVLAFLFSSCLVGCSNNYSTGNTISQTSAYPKIIERANKDKRYFIMYSGIDTYRITSAQVERAKQQFTVHLAKVDSAHASRLRNPGTMTEKAAYMYMQDSTSYTLDEPHTIPINKIARIETH